MHRAGVTVVLLLCGCGGRLRDASGGGDAGAEAATLGPDAGCDPGGVRICDPAAGCPVLDTVSCPGRGCGDVFSVDATTTGDGVCWSDLHDEGSTSCAVCDDGESCILRDTEYVCVPDAVCGRFWSLGVTGSCVYADKRAYSGAPLPTEPTSCPQGLMGQNVACGGACGSCPATDARRCVGRSPAHPVGVCAFIPSSSNPEDPAAIPTCSLGSNGYTLACPAAPSGLVCGVFSATLASDLATAKQYGLCLPAADCAVLASWLPGGFSCYDATGGLSAGG